MESSLPTLAASLISQLIRFISTFSGYVYLAIIVAVLVCLALKYGMDALNVGPFGRFASQLRRPGSLMLHHVRMSRFYYPLRQALGFDPAVLMILIATAIVCYVVSEIVRFLLMLLGGVVRALEAVDQGNYVTAGKNFIGVLLLAVIFYLLSLMLIVFVNWMFGLLAGIGFKASQRIDPLLRIFEFGGRLQGFSFFILYFVLSFVAQAVISLFLT